MVGYGKTSPSRTRTDFGYIKDFSSALFLGHTKRERGRRGSEEFFGIYRFVAHEHSVAELIFHIIE